MGEAIWATWYDLPEIGRTEHLDWLHEHHMPALLRLPGLAWAAHYEITGGGAAMDQIGARLARPDGDDVPLGKDFVLLVGAAEPHVFFHPRIDEAEAALQAPQLADRQQSRSAVFIEEAYVTGPEVEKRPKGTGGAPAIQFGSFRTRTVADGWDLGAWYAQYRLPAMSGMGGCIATRKLLAVAGWPRHGILYEFTSLEARHAHFQSHESLALDEQVWTHRIINYTVHAPGSPHVGRRIWPPVIG